MSLLLCQGTAHALPLADTSIDCCITSPPYYRHRDYGVGAWLGGEPACTHSPAATPGKRGLARSTLSGGKRTTGHQQEGYGWRCPRCGAIRAEAQLGLEPTPEAYLQHLFTCFREVWRVLKPTGTLWLNLGDSTRNKQVLGIPWRFALGLQADGWFLRSAITWCKTAPMPESVKDRPTASTEMVFFLTKQARYYYNQSITRVYTGNGWHRSSFTSRHDEATRGGLGRQERRERPGRNMWNYWVLGPEPTSNGHFASYPKALVERCLLAGSPPGGVVLDPFCGSGTTLLVARQWGRHAIGVDLSWPYLSTIAGPRLDKGVQGLPLFEVPV